MADRDDPPRDTIDHLQSDGLPTVVPPGLDAVPGLGARRRMLRVGTASVAVAAAIMIVLPGLLASRIQAPTDPIASDPTASTPRTSTPISTPTPSAGPAAPSPSPSPSPSSTGAASDGSGVQPTAQTGHECTPIGVIDVTELFNYGYVTVSVRRPVDHPDWAGLLCPGETIRVLWASYTVDPAGVKHVYKYEVRTLDLDHPTWRMFVDIKWIGLCGPTWYVSSGNDSIPSTIPLGAQAFPHKVHWEPKNSIPGCDPSPEPSPTDPLSQTG